MKCLSFCLFLLVSFWTLPDALGADCVDYGVYGGTIPGSEVDFVYDEVFAEDHTVFAVGPEGILKCEYAADRTPYRIVSIPGEFERGQLTEDVFIALSNDGLHVFDKNTMSPVGAVTLGTVSSYSYHGEVLAVLDHTELSLYSVKSWSEPVLVSTITLNTPDRFRHGYVYVEDGYAWVAIEWNAHVPPTTAGGNIRLIDISDMQHPLVVDATEEQPGPNHVPKALIEFDGTLFVRTQTPPDSPYTDMYWNYISCLSRTEDDRIVVGPGVWIGKQVTIARPFDSYFISDYYEEDTMPDQSYNHYSLSAYRFDGGFQRVAGAYFNESTPMVAVPALAAYVPSSNNRIVLKEDNGLRNWLESTDNVYDDSPWVYPEANNSWIAMPRYIDGYVKLEVYDGTTSPPALIHIISGDRNISRFAFCGDLLFYQDSAVRFQDLTELPNPTTTTTDLNQPLAQDICGLGDYLVISRGAEGLDFYNVMEDGGITHLEHIDRSTGHMTHVGRYLIMNNPHQTQYLVDISDPGQPIAHAEFTGIGYEALALYHHNFLLAKRDDYWGTAIRWYDISTPDAPQQIAVDYSIHTWIYSMVVSDERIYAGVGHAGIRLYENVTDGLLGDPVDLPIGNVTKLILSDKHLIGLVGTAIRSLPLDCDDPLPTHIPSFDVAWSGLHLRLTVGLSGASSPGNDLYLYASCGSTSWHVPLNQVDELTWEALDAPYDHGTCDQVVYTLYAESQQGQILLGSTTADMSQDHITRPTLSVSPNPCNAATQISYFLPAPGIAEVSVYALDGRLVRRLVKENCPAGNSDVFWRGEDEFGQAVASGHYLIRLSTPTITVSKGVTLLK